MVAIYVDDCLYAGTKAFSTKANVMSETFDSKLRQLPPFNFAGITIERPTAQVFELHQQLYVHKLQMLTIDAPFTEFRTIRHKLVWSANCRPYVLAGLNILSQVTENLFEAKHFTQINSLISHLQKHHDVRMRFVSLYPASLKLIVYSDGSFACNQDLSSQFGYIVLIGRIRDVQT